MQHIMERDAAILSQMNATFHRKKKMLPDIYGSELFQAGSVDADDQYDLEAKFASLKETWNTMLPGFHDWLKKKRINLFIEFINRSPLDRATLGNSFYNNWLEVLHKLQKKKIEEGEIEHEVCQISKPLNSGKSRTIERLSGLFLSMANITLHMPLNISMSSPPSGSDGMRCKKNSI